MAWQRDGIDGMAALDLIGRFFSLAANRDGQFSALEPAALEAPAQTAPPHVPADAARDLEVAIGTKLLEGWLANRQQTLVPHTLNFRALGPDQGRLLIAVMAAAAQADGRVDDSEARQLPLVLARVGGGQAETQLLAQALREPQSLLPLLAKVQEAGLGAHAYAAALLAINRRGRANRAFLEYLSARLGITREVARSLERRYQA